MGKKSFIIAACFVAVIACSGCERLDNDIEKHGEGDAPFIALEDVARLLAELSIGDEQLGEVYNAVNASSSNGYDEEYTMRDLFRTPGAGVGDSELPAGTKAESNVYERPLRDIIREHLSSGSSGSLSVRSGGRILVRSGGCAPEQVPGTRAGEEEPQDTGAGISVDDYLDALENSDIQIYWPFSENWDRKAFPTITFDPSDGSEVNIGYRLVTDDAGDRHIEEVIVDEKMAEQQAVWVVNRNDDAGYTSLEMLRKQDPDWGTEGGGSIVVKPQLVRSTSYGKPLSSGHSELVSESPLKTLILKDFTMLRNYDSWFAGASEFFVKVGAVEDFTASTEAELQLYSPAVTDFMIVVKRKYVGEPRPFNAVLVSEWTDQLDQIAFMIIEDDGGKRTSWNCTAVVKIASKSYGFEISLPFNTRDDIVWRGQLSRRYILANDNVTGHFGDVDLTFEIKEY